MTRSEESLRTAFSLLSVLQRYLRHALIATPALELKISICDSIQDTAHALAAVSAYIRDRSSAAATLPQSLAETCRHVATRTSEAGAVQPLLACIDGISTVIQSFMPDLAAIVRRSLETTNRAYGLSHTAPRTVEPSDNPHHDGVVSDLPWPALPTVSAREQSQRPSIVTSLPHLPLLQQLHAQIFGIEVCAAEVCAAMALRFPNLPWSLDLDLARQTYEEGRHARLLLAAFKRRRGDPLAYAPSQDIWLKVMAGRSLSEMLCIEQLLGEGHSLGSDLMAADLHRKDGNSDLVEIHLSLHADELTHVALGITWFRRLAAGDGERLLLDLEPGYAVTPPPEPWFSAHLRREVGFTDTEIARQQHRMATAARQLH